MDREKQKTDAAVAVVLAAGPGKRMGGEIAKVLVELEGTPLVAWVMRAIQAVGIERRIVVVGHQGEQVKAALHDFKAEFVWQHERLGTGHAVQQAEPLLKSHSGPVIILLGDVPRIRPQTIRNVLATHCQSKASATILTANLDDPTGYGRIVRGADDSLHRLIEERDADDNIKKIKEINTGMMCFYAPDLFSALPGLTNTNAQSEFYLTDVIGILLGRGLPVAACRLEDPTEALGVNSPAQLRDLERLLIRDSGG